MPRPSWAAASTLCPCCPWRALLARPTACTITATSPRQTLRNPEMSLRLSVARPLYAAPTHRLTFRPRQLLLPAAAPMAWRSCRGRSRRCSCSCGARTQSSAPRATRRARLASVGTCSARRSGPQTAAPLARECTSLLAGRPGRHLPLQLPLRQASRTRRAAPAARRPRSQSGWRRVTRRCSHRQQRGEE